MCVCMSACMCLNRSESRRAGRRESDGKESSATSSTLLCQRIDKQITRKGVGKSLELGWRQRLLTRWSTIGPLLDYESFLKDLEWSTQVRVQYCTSKWSANTVQWVVVTVITWLYSITSECCVEQMQCEILGNAHARVGESCFSRQDLHDRIGHWMLD